MNKKERAKKDVRTGDEEELRSSRAAAVRRVVGTVLAQLLCLCLALGIWLYIVQEEVDRETVRYAVAVELTGEEALLDEWGLTVFDQSFPYVDVSYTGTARELAEIEETALTVRADVSAAEELGWNVCRLTLTGESGELQGVLENNSVMVYLDRAAAKEVPLQAEAVCTQRTDRTATATAPAASVTVQGPEQAVGQVVLAVLQAKVTGDELGTGQVETGEFVFYDASGKELEGLYLSAAPEALTVTVRVTPKAAG